MSARVAAARPLSAWVLVLVASACVWITGQLAAPVVGVALVGLAISARHRTAPLAAQTHDWLLNFLMMGITATTIAVALRGNPSTVALAHFAALTQALQLFDARPRKSEFLLVALALFQVILAANLTDSVLFPPLLVAFTLAATWTLLVHTLRTESLAAGVPHASDRAITPAFARMTALSTVAAIALALVFFLALPRMRTSMWNAGGRGSQALSGFSDRIELGSVESIGEDTRAVMRIETLEGSAPEPIDAYWRGLAFDAFDGRRWSVERASGGGARRPIPGPPRLGVELGAERDATHAQRILREPVAAGVLFAAGEPRRIVGALDRIERDANDSLYSPASAADRVQYTVWSELAQRDHGALARDRASVPKEPRSRRMAERYLALPELDPRIAELAREIAASAASDAERVAAIERWLRANGRYSLRPPVVAPDAARTPVEVFLLDERTGHCEYFASAMVVLARSLGLPARLVNGFAGGRPNELGGFTTVALADAHAWVEIHFENAGWVRYDPTPPDERLRAALPLGLADQMRELADAIETWWFRRVVEFDAADQMSAVRRALRALAGLRESTRAASAEAAPSALARFRPSREHVARALACAAALALSAAFVQRRRRARAHDAIPACYARALALLRRRGFARAPAQTAREFARELADALPDDAARAFEQVTESYLAERFGGRASAPTTALAVDALARALAGASR